MGEKWSKHFSISMSSAEVQTLDHEIPYARGGREMAQTPGIKQSGRDPSGCAAAAVVLELDFLDEWQRTRFAQRRSGLRHSRAITWVPSLESQMSWE